MKLQPELTVLLSELATTLNTIITKKTPRALDIANLLTQMNNLKQPLVGTLLIEKES